MPDAGSLRARPPIDERHLRLLRIFRAVAEAGGLTAAEGRLRMERSTISRHLQALERLLGGALCQRGPGGFELTELGRVALEVAATAADTLDLVRDRLDAARHAMRGELRLGVADGCLGNPRCRLPRALAAFRARAPGVSLVVTVGSSEALRAELAARRIDLAIAELPPAGAALDQLALFAEELRLYAALPPPDGGPPPIVDELSARGYALATLEHDTRAEGLARRLGLVHRATARGGMQALVWLVAGGGLVGHLPTHAVDALPTPHHLGEVRGAAALVRKVGYGLFTPREDGGLPRAGELFATLLRHAHAD